MPIGFEDAGAALRELVAARFPAADLAAEEIAVEFEGRSLYVTVLPYGPDSAVIQVMAPLLAGAADSDELCEAVATADLHFGRLLLFDDGSGGRSVLHVVRFHADQLCADALDHALASVLATANRLDPELESRFGATFTLEGPS